MKNQFKTRTEALNFLSSVSWLQQDLATGTFSKIGVYQLAFGETKRPIYFAELNTDQWEIKVNNFYIISPHPENGKVDDETFQQMYLNRK